MNSADGNPYEAPQAAAEQRAGSRARERRIGWAVASFLFRVLWVVFMAAVFLSPPIVSTKGPRTPYVVFVIVFIVASSPAVALFRLAWRARR
jgi:hypothetical protein